MYEPLWWHWVAGGIVLSVMELFIPSFTILWFGLGAIVTGVLLALFPGLPLPGQLALWIVFSCAFVLVWFRYVKPRKDRTTSGLSKEAVIGAVGMVSTGVSSPYDKGKVRFQMPLCGDDEWPFVADEALRQGDRVRVVDVEGQLLRVKKEG
jgi:membrane protein implicated in regulation of membrane protease activity